MYHEWKHRPQYWETSFNASFMKLMVSLRRAYDLSDFTVSHNLVQKCLELIDAHLDADLTVDAIAKCLYVNPNYLSRKVCQTIGMPITTYIWQKRVHTATELMQRRPDLSVMEVARRAGFKTAAHFSRKFKDIIGCSPSNHNQQIKNI
jgi:two-component system response regulator YesN